MGCRCDYMQPTARENESANVMRLLKEVGLIDGNVSIYGNVNMVDQHAAQLCKFCQENDVKQYSLELQIWWKDHQAMDAARIQRELEQAELDSKKQAALSKLTDYEKKLLGL